MTPSSLVWVVALVILWILVIAIAYLTYVHIVARQARRRGYSYWTWVAAGCLANPILMVVVLALLPDRHKKTVLRQQERAELEAKLAALEGFHLLPQEEAVPQQSLGDLPTVEPGGLSVGDEETRL
jgi:hypothetical protein